MGMESASNEIIVFTDADCRVPTRWLSTVENYFTPDTDFVQGITSYKYASGMNRVFFGLQSIDFLSHGIVSAAAIGAGLPINANANNLAFRRAAFERVGGYGTDGRVVSADDDQLMQKLWKANRRVNGGERRRKIRFMTEHSGSVETAPTKTVAALFEQRKRWGSITVHYGIRQIALLSAVFAFYLTISAVAVMSIISPARYLPILLSLMFVKLSGELALLIPGTRIFRKKNLRKYIIPASILQLPLTLAAVIFGVFGKFDWKGRRMGRTVPTRPAE